MITATKILVLLTITITITIASASAIASNIHGSKYKKKLYLHDLQNLMISKTDYKEIIRKFSDKINMLMWQFHLLWIKQWNVSNPDIQTMVWSASAVTST